MSAVKVVIVYESRTGNTERAARVIGTEIRNAGHEVSVFPTKGISLEALAESDLVVIGTWTDGLIIAGHRPGGAGNIARHLPEIWNKPVYTFVTYAVRPGNVLRGFRRLLESKGAKVLGGLELGRRHLDSDAIDFAEQVLRDSKSLQSA